MLTILFSLFLSFSAHCQINGKYDIDLAEVSRKYEAEGLPTGNLDLPWAPRGTSGELDKDTVPSYRHMHAFVVSAFYSSKKEERAVALKWLERYRCENWVACRDLDQFYSGAFKANVLTMKVADRKKYEALRKKFSAAAKKSVKSMPEQTGVCSPSAQTPRWLEQEYQILCPRQSLGTDPGFSEGAEALTQLQRKIGRDSRQDIMSSSFLKSLRHVGEKHCQAEWETIVSCGGGVDTERTYKCAMNAGKVTCK